MRCVALFAGIGGIEVGLQKSDIRAVQFCEIDSLAQRVLNKHFRDVEIVGDVQKLENIQPCDILTAGFPCQDISQAGPKKGIEGARSGLVSHMFRILNAQEEANRPEWILIENVSNIISLHKGDAMSYLTEQLERLGYSWAYRVVDARAFGVPQRRLRMVLVASKHEDVRQIVLSQNIENPPVDDSLGEIDEEAYYGFYWTEGRLGLGWAKNAVPTLKNGSTIGIPSPPAIWVPQENLFGTPDIRDAERMQGFTTNWTLVSSGDNRQQRNNRWRQVGNAVCTKMSEWVGHQIVNPRRGTVPQGRPFLSGRWPKACWGAHGQKFSVDVSTWPVMWKQHPLSHFLRYPIKPLSFRGASGFYDRAIRSTLIRYPERFLRSLEQFIETRREIENVND